MKQIFVAKSVFLLMIAASFINHLNAQHFFPTDSGSNIKFTIKNFGINSSGIFKGLKGNIQFQPNNLSSSNFNISVDAATIDTHIGARDKHLKKEEYFDVEKFPVLSFISTKITAGNSGEAFVMYGKLTMKGIAKEITFPFSAHAQGSGYLFSGNFQLNRRDFNVGGKSMVLSDKLDVSLVVFVKKYN